MDHRQIRAAKESAFIFYYFLSENSAMNIGYRWRHLSNAKLNMPNDGINTNFITFGYAAFF